MVVPVSWDAKMACLRNRRGATFITASGAHVIPRWFERLRTTFKSYPWVGYHGTYGIVACYEHFGHVSSGCVHLVPV